MNQGWAWMRHRPLGRGLTCMCVGLTQITTAGIDPHFISVCSQRNSGKAEGRWTPREIFCSFQTPPEWLLSAARAQAAA